MIGQTGLHGRSYSQGLMDTAKVVPFSDAFLYEEDKAEKIMGEYASGVPPQWHILRHLTN